MDRISVLGCPITKLSLEGFVSRMETFIASREPHYVAMVNVAKLIKMRSDKELTESVLTADLIGADGVPLVWVSRLFGTPLPGRVNGTDLMYKLLERASDKHYRIFFLGAREEVLRQVLQRVRRTYPGALIAGSQHGYFPVEDESAVANNIRRAEPDILLIAFDTPKKELWVKRYRDTMNVPVIHGVGGSFDVLAGFIPRAPLWMQRSGLEWLFRLAQEPRRMWRRYLLTNALFIVLVLYEWACHRIAALRPTVGRR